VIAPPDLASLDSTTKDALILAQAETIALLTKRIADLEARLGLPPKTPDNSSLPPSTGHKASGEGGAKAKSKAHAGAHRPLQANPTHKRDVVALSCQHCGADVSATAQKPVLTYDRIEIPKSSLK